MGDDPSRKVRAIPPTYFDDIRDFTIHEGVFRFTPYIWQTAAGEGHPEWVPLRPMTCPVKNVGPMASKAMFFATRHSFYGVLDLPPFYRPN